MVKRCPVCKKNVDPDDPKTVPYKEKFLHDYCFDTFIRVNTNEKKDLISKRAEQKKECKRQPKPKAELKDPLSEEEYARKKDFYEYLRSVIGDDFPSKVYAIVEKMIRQYSYTFEGMKHALVYMNEIREKELTGDVVGLIPYYYSEAENFYKEVNRIDQENAKKDMNKMYKSVTVRITPKARIPKQLPFDD